MKVTQCPGRVSANTRRHQLRWGDREWAYYMSCARNTYDWPDRCFLKLSSLLVVFNFHKVSHHCNLRVNYRYSACQIQKRCNVATRSTVETPWLHVLNFTNGKYVEIKRTNKKITQCVCEREKELERERARGKMYVVWNSTYFYMLIFCGKDT